MLTRQSNVLAVTVTIKSRIVTVKGPRGQVTKDFSHIGVEMVPMKQESKKRTGNFIRFRMWFGAYKQACAVRTLRSLINNMITGTTEVSYRPSSLRSFRSFEVVVQSVFLSFSIYLIITLMIGLPIQDETRTRSFPH